MYVLTHPYPCISKYEARAYLLRSENNPTVREAV